MDPRLPPLLACSLLAASLGVSGCDDTCSADASPSIQLGQGVGGAFVPLEDEQLVGLDVAPQGGFGVKTLISTTGLVAGDEALASVQLDVLIEGALAGSFWLDETRLLCRGSSQGGLVSDVVVGFDDATYSTPDDLLLLDMQVVDLDVTVTDSEDNEANILHSVIINAGG
jgi:hypothetical protein